MLISGHDRNRALMNQPLRIGLIGAGMVSRHHLIAWASLSDQARVVAVADPSSENAARRASEFEIPQTWGSAEAMLARMQTRAELYQTIGYAEYESLDASIERSIVPPDLRNK